MSVSPEVNRAGRFAPATYRVLANALALQGFTVPEMARHADVKVATVRTVLGRYTHLFDVKTERTRRPGGQLHRWTVKYGTDWALGFAIQEVDLFHRFVIRAQETGTFRFTDGPYDGDVRAHWSEHFTVRQLMPSKEIRHGYYSVVKDPAGNWVVEDNLPIMRWDGWQEAAV